MKSSLNFTGKTFPLNSSPFNFFFLISQVLNPKDGDELLSFLFMGTSCVQDLQHLSSLVTSFLGLGTHRALGSLRVCNERP